MKLQLFSNCIPVQGITRSLICDLQRNIIKLIPNSMYELLQECIGMTVLQIKELYNGENDEIIDEYISFLNDNEFIFFSENIHSFPKLSMRWEKPFPITNMIIDRDNNSDYDIINLLSQIDEIMCRHIQIRLFYIEEVQEIETWLNHIQTTHSNILTIELIIPYKNKEITEKLINIVSKYRRARYVLIHSIPEKMLEKLPSIKKLYYSSTIINSKAHCGQIEPVFFANNIETFTEGQHHNTCLNRKISIDLNGEIKNCPSSTTIFGNIKDTSLEEVLQHPKLEELWHITKDQIDVCKTCEFRYVCTDCRAYIENPDDIYSKPLKCGYNPETNKWEEWSTNPLKQQAIDHYGLREIIQP